MVGENMSAPEKSGDELIAASDMPAPPEHVGQGADRRSWLALTVGWAAAVLAYITPVVAGLRAFLSAAGRGAAQGADFCRVASLDQLPEDGSPVTVAVLAEREDAWNRFPAQPIGGVLLRRLPDGQVQALNTRCPHAGCTIIFETSQRKLFCPCHNASFDLDGRRLEASSPSPRDLDTLQVKIEDQTEIWVEFRHFRTGIPDKIPE